MLKSLELFGFKSFADRTNFDFDPGITGVVGPNGSGKSNVVDAIKWLLGDQSAKSLRGKEMTDVIFNGTTGRKASNFSEATLTFDNTNGILPIESQEVQIGRRLWRSGDSEYLINNAPARLKDVRNLFMGTGAGHAAYCIIEQGRVDQILQANASSRRGIFEEAAGVSRYKARKIEAERKLERVDQNLLRLTDIVDEVEAQLNSIRNQAQKAAKYREISRELKELWLGLAADDYRHHSSRLHSVEESMASYKRQIEELIVHLQARESDLTNRDKEISELDDQLRTAERRCASNRESIVSHEATVRHQTARESELELELDRLREQCATMASRAREIIGELEHVSGQRDRFEIDFNTKKQEQDSRLQQVSEFSAELDTQRETVEDHRNRLLERMKELSVEENRLSGLSSQQENNKQAEVALQQECSRIDSQIVICRDNLDRQTGLVAEAGETRKQTEENIEEIKQRRDDLIRAQNQAHKILAEQREQRSACQARKSVLEDLEIRQEGLGIGAKEILSRAQEIDEPPWKLIHGSVADLLDVDLEQAALLEVALGSRAQLIVIEEFGPLIDYLNSGSGTISGRVGFIACSLGNETGESSKTPTPLSALGEPPAIAGRIERFSINADSTIDLSLSPGVQMRADALVRSSSQVPSLPKELLSDTWIVDTLDSAIQLARDVGRGCRFVTLQGEFLESDGTLTVGTVRSESALVSRKSELRRLKNDLMRLERGIVDEENRLSRVDSTLNDVNIELIAMETELQDSTQRYNAFESTLTGFERELQSRRQEREKLQAKAEELVSQQNQLEGQIQQTHVDLAELNEDRQSIQQEIEQQERDIARTEHRLQTVQRQQAAEQLELAKQEERLESLRNACRRIEQDQQQRIQQRDEAARRFESVSAKRREIRLHILNTGALLGDLYLQDERLNAQSALLMEQKEVLRSDRAVMQKQVNQMRTERRELNESQHQDEIKAGDIRFQISTLEKRMEEEYQLILSEVVASGISAYRGYLNEHHQDHAIPPEADVIGESVEDRVENEGSPSKDLEETNIDARYAKEQHQSDGPAFEEIRDKLESRVNRLRRKLQHMGSVNTDSLHDLDELENRYGHLREQLDDLVEAKNALEEIISRINVESKRLFVDTFEAVRGHFQTLFRKAFGGGDGDIVLEDPEDVLECGIDIVARPPGKELKSISLMSGGEKTLTAFALLLALFRSRPSPYCLLDEVDAALDEANVGRLLALLEEFKESTQFIVITHKKPTMTIADVLYGVTMEESGVSKRMSIRFEDVHENGDFKTNLANSPDDSSMQNGQSKEAA